MAANVRTVSNENGKELGVFVPMDEWKAIQTKLRKTDFLDSFKQALKELKMMRDGKLPEPDINDLFND